MPQVFFIRLKPKFLWSFKDSKERTFWKHDRAGVAQFVTLFQTTDLLRLQERKWRINVFGRNNRPNKEKDLTLNQISFSWTDDTEKRCYKIWDFIETGILTESKLTDSRQMQCYTYPASSRVSFEGDSALLYCPTIVMIQEGDPTWQCFAMKLVLITAHVCKCIFYCGLNTTIQFFSSHLKGILLSAFGK